MFHANDNCESRRLQPKICVEGAPKYAEPSNEPPKRHLYPDAGVTQPTVEVVFERGQVSPWVWGDDPVVCLVCIVAGEPIPAGGVRS